MLAAGLGKAESLLRRDYAKVWDKTTAATSIMNATCSTLI
jgi:hypothetical protein